MNICGDNNLVPRNLRSDLCCLSRSVELWPLQLSLWSLQRERSVCVCVSGKGGGKGCCWRRGLILHTININMKLCWPELGFVEPPFLSFTPI